MENILLWARELLHFVHAHGHAALYFLLALEEAGLPLPLPGDTVVAYAGYLASRGDMVWWQALVAAVGASMSGSTVLYFLCREKGRPMLIRYGKYLHLTPAREMRIERWVQKRRGVAVFFGRLVPGMRIGTTALAGMFAIPFWSFLFYQTLSAVLWWGAWLWLGSTLGRRLVRMLRLSPTHFAFALVPILVVAAAMIYVRHRAAKEQQLLRRKPDQIISEAAHSETHSS